MDQTFVGSTPANAEVREILSLSATTTVDFIRWHLMLSNSKIFSLDITYGESKPNTLGFKEDHHLRFKGVYKELKSHSSEVVYEFNSDSFRSSLKMVVLNANLLHLLNRTGNLMIGNGGWSYSLNNLNPVKTQKSLYRSPDAWKDEASVQTYDGRTPCQEIANEYGMKVSKGCFKLKWRLTLYRDTVTGEPTTYVIRKVVDNAPRNVTGKWIIIDEPSTNPKAVIYQLDPGDPANTMFLLAADEGVIFFLKKDRSYFTGNENFSWALNRVDFKSQ